MLRPAWIKEAFNRLKKKDLSEETITLALNGLERYIEELESKLDDIKLELSHNEEAYGKRTRP